MEVNNESFSDHTEPSEQISPAEEIIAEAPEVIETVEEIETAKQIELAELSQPTQILQKPQPYRNKNRKFGRAYKKMKCWNFFKNKSCDVDPSPTEQIEVTQPNIPPEEWTTCRLRQHARERLREKLTAIAEGETLLTLEIKRLENKKRIEPKRNIFSGNEKEKKERPTETEEEKCLRLERRRIKYAMCKSNETEEHRFVRLERLKMARLKRLVTETEKEKSLRIESERRAKERYKLKIESLRFARVQQLNFVGDMEDQEADIVSGLDFEIGKFTPKVLHEESFTESESTTDDTTRKIKKETNFDVVSNVLHCICVKPYSQQHNRLQRFDNFGTSRSSNYILSTVVWHKLNGPTDKGLDENLSKGPFTK